MWRFLAVGVLLSLAACGEEKSETYATWAAAKRAGAVERGWVPPFVPTSAWDIRDRHDLDTNKQKLTFSVPPEKVAPMLESIAPYNELKREWAAAAFEEAGWNIGERQKAVAILLCTRTYSGILVANHQTGHAVYISPAEWAGEQCPRPR